MYHILLCYIMKEENVLYMLISAGVSLWNYLFLVGLYFLWCSFEMAQYMVLSAGVDQCWRHYTHRSAWLSGHESWRHLEIQFRRSTQLEGIRRAAREWWDALVRTWGGNRAVVTDIVVLPPSELWWIIATVMHRPNASQIQDREGGKV